MTHEGYVYKQYLIEALARWPDGSDNREYARVMTQNYFDALRFPIEEQPKTEEQDHDSDDPTRQDWRGTLWATLSRQLQTGVIVPRDGAAQDTDSGESCSGAVARAGHGRDATALPAEASNGKAEDEG